MPDGFELLKELKMSLKRSAPAEIGSAPKRRFLSDLCEQSIHESVAASLWAMGMVQPFLSYVQRMNVPSTKWQIHQHISNCLQQRKVAVLWLVVTFDFYGFLWVVRVGS